jgi:hypothetical protein
MFGVDGARVILSSQTSDYRGLNVGISCKDLHSQVSAIEQVCASSFPLLSKLEDLYIYESTHSPQDWQDNIENSLWLELLHPFIAVKNLYLSKEFARRIVPVLQELVGGRTTEVLPALENIFLKELRPSRLIQEGIRKFVAARQLSGHPITVSLWGRDSE